MSAVIEGAVERRAIRVVGAVQGVGFRPFVFRLARDMGLTGWVLNDGEGVSIEVEGPAAMLGSFEQRLRADAPALSRVEGLASKARARLGRDDGFRILASGGGAITTSIPPDTVTCDDCLGEMFDASDRRHRYGFINCTQCGPRYTLTRQLPYDRAQTSMAAFEQCPLCAREYADPASRRFHAEPNACPACGPKLALIDPQGRSLPGDPIAATLDLLRAGAIVAIKGLGGFQLACDAGNAAAVARLRERKHREEKPFAVMAANAASAARWAETSAPEQRLLQSRERPIVLLRLHPGRGESLVGISPGLDSIGVMLPCTPIQFLLFHEAAGRPSGTAWLRQANELLLVMTSANPGGEPLVVGNDEALARLAGIADALLVHDRDIVARCDDSVVRVVRGATQMVRRARGFTPVPIRLPRAGPSVLATGAWLNNTVCITRGDEAFLSPHLGDLDNAATCSALVEAVDHLCDVLAVRPEAVAHDLHPDFFSTRFAHEFAAARGLPLRPVQHHHAHIAAVAAEHGVDAPLLGVALDGVGLGDDGAAWGGELLLVDGASYRRLGHVATLPMPGGDAAAREPWRMAAAALHRLGRGAQIAERFAGRPAAAAVEAMLARDLRSPPTSSMGRWFDAAAALLGVRDMNRYEGQAAMMLEARAALGSFDASDDELAGLVVVRLDGELDPTPLLARLADEGDAARGAVLFHHAMAAGLARWVGNAATRTGLTTVALGGGCFANARLATALVDRLEARGLRVLQAQRVPPGDGGLALGQAWIAIRAQSKGD